MFTNPFLSKLFAEVFEKEDPDRLEKMRRALRQHREKLRRQRKKQLQITTAVLDAIEFDIDTLALLVAILIALLKEKGVLKKGEIKALLSKADKLDGKEDGRLDIRVLRRLLGISETYPENQSEGTETSTS